MTMFEVRIVCKRLPRSINELDNTVPFDDSSITSMSTENHQNQNDHFQHGTNRKDRKKMQEHKRQVLAKTLEEYETSIEQNEYLYQEELLKFEYQSSLPTDQMNNVMT